MIEFFAAAAGLVGGGLITAIFYERRLARRERRLLRWQELLLQLKGSIPTVLPSVEDPIESEIPFGIVREKVLAMVREGSQLRVVLDAMSEALALIDSEHGVILCNRTFSTIFRAAQDEKLRVQSEAPGALREILRAIDESRDGGKSIAVEVRLDTTPPRDFLITVTPYSDDATRGAVILTGFDVTARKRAEQVRSEFVANVSHELRTPLAAIRGYVETMVDEQDRPDAVPVQRFLPIIQQHALRLNNLIEDLLILSRIESRGMQFNMIPMQVSHAVDACVATLVSAAEKKQLRLIKELPRQLPEVRADQNSVERILLNLVENAIKYSDERSEIRITARQQQNELCISVHDQGVGIPKEHQQRVFERFYRVDKARSRKAGGTGLGLSIVKHLVQSHGGDVWVESDPGRGSVFSFTLPLAQQHAAG